MQAAQYNQMKPVLPLKNLAGALLFCVFLGPLGLLYASSLGGITMLVIFFIVVCCKLVVPIMLTWLGCSVWGVLAVNRYNKKIIG